MKAPQFWYKHLTLISLTLLPVMLLYYLLTKINQTIKSDLTKLRDLLASDDTMAEQNAANIIRQLKFSYKMLSEIELKEDVLSDF